MRYGLLLCLLLLFGSQPLLAANSLTAGARGDTTINGRTYLLIPAEHLLSTLRQAPAGTILQCRNAVFVGRISASLANLDTVRADLDLTDVHFTEEVNLNKVVFLGNISLDRARLKGGISLLDARIHGELRLTASQCDRHATGKRAIFLSSVDFSDSRFDEITSFIEAEFRGANASFARAQFQDAVYFERARFDGRTDFQDATFKGLISCKEARWDGDVSFAGARFHDRTLFWQNRFARSLIFDTALTVGEIDFNRAVFTGPASFRQAIFIRAARFSKTAFHDRLTFAGSRFQKDAEFYAARFAAGAQFNSSFEAVLDLRHTRTPLLDLRPPAGDLKSGAVDSTFAADSRVLLQDASYDQLLASWPHLAGHLAPQDSTSIDDLAPIYASLRHQLRSRGLGKEADDCYVEWMERRRHSLSWADAERYGLQLFYLTTDYGTDLFRFALFTFTCVLIFALIYRLLRSADENSPSSLADCAYYSIHTFLHSGAASWNLTGKLRILSLLEALLGWICWGLFIATLVSLLLR